MNPDFDLEKQVDGALRSLPTPRAPRTLAPRVMAALAVRSALPWYRRTWFEWPRGWQAVSATLTVAFLATLAVVAPWRALAGAEWVLGITDGVQTLADSIAGTANRYLSIALPLWRALAQSYLLYALAVAGMLMTTVIALGGAARQLVLKEIQSR